MLTQTAKDKEVTSNNVHQIIAKISWKELAVQYPLLPLEEVDALVIVELRGLASGQLRPSWADRTRGRGGAEKASLP
mgnify:CR=1 FL=1